MKANAKRQKRWICGNARSGLVCSRERHLLRIICNSSQARHNILVYIVQYKHINFLVQYAVYSILYFMLQYAVRTP